MSSYETVEVPFQTIGDRQCLTEMSILEQPWLLDFIERFKGCFEYDGLRCVFWYDPA